jgi:23S rRNA pseudouridine2605 synthase
MKYSRENIAFVLWIGTQCLCFAQTWAFEPATMLSVAAAARRCSGSVLLRYVESGSSRFIPQRQSLHAAWRLSASNSPSGDNRNQHTDGSAIEESKTKKKPSVTGKTYRADRVLSNRGWGSRSECFEIIKQRRVFQKFGDGETFPVLGPSEKISMDADLWIDKNTQVPRPPPLLRVYHKPKWVLSVMNDKKGRKNLSELDFIHSMHPVGRLDYDTSGLLLFSSDGTLTQTLLHPSNEIQKEYVALVAGSVNEEELRQTLARGVSTSMGAFPADLIEAKPIPSEQVTPLIDDILKNLPPEYDLDKLEEKGYLNFKDATELSEVRLVVEEGKHRMVRRILANSGFPVIGLKRERLGVIRLDDLKAGSHRELSQKELEWAESLQKRKPKK